MGFDQRPARAAKRLVIPKSAPVAPPKSPQTPTAPAKSGMRAIILFIIATTIGGLATTAGFNGLIPGIPAVTLPEFAGR